MQLSKAMSWLLRHGAQEARVQMSADGYVRVSDMLRHHRFKGFSVQDVEAAVLACEKQRFGLTTKGAHEGAGPGAGALYIRANQGHTVHGLDDHAMLTPVDCAAHLPMCVHGTYRNVLDVILRDGLSRMARNHIHFARGLPEAKGAAVSGMRGSCEVEVHVDVAKAMAAGIRFFTSQNGVILSTGDARGMLPAVFFARVVDRATGKLHPLPQATCTAAAAEHDAMPSSARGVCHANAVFVRKQLDAGHQPTPAQLAAQLKRVVEQLRGTGVSGAALARLRAGLGALGWCYDTNRKSAPRPPAVASLLKWLESA